MDVNVVGTFNLLDHFLNSCTHFINISSVSATDDNFKQSVYSLTKHLSDIIVDYYQGRSSLTLTTLRFSQIYDGAGLARKMQPGLFYFAERIKNDEPLTIFGDKNRKRSYMPVELLCKSVLHSIQNSIKGNHDVIMADNYSPVELASIFLEMSGRKKASFRFDNKVSSIEYSIPPNSKDFESLLERESNIPYFKALFDNV